MSAIKATNGLKSEFFKKKKNLSSVGFSERITRCPRSFAVIMPPSALDHLSKYRPSYQIAFKVLGENSDHQFALYLYPLAGRLNITYPMLFKLTNKNSDRMTHCGVLEFVADEGICYLPHWVGDST